MNKLKNIYTCNFYKDSHCYKLDFYNKNRYAFSLKFSFEPEDQIIIPKKIRFKLENSPFNYIIDFPKTHFKTISEAKEYILKFLNE